MISNLSIGGTEVRLVSDDTYNKLRRKRYRDVLASENMRKRVAGEYVPTCVTGAPPVKLAAHQRAESGIRCCMAPNCRKVVQFRLKDGSGEG